MYRCVAVGIALLPSIVVSPAQKPPPQSAASVTLWVDTSSGSPCEQSTPASGDWMIHNNESRNVRVTVRRILTKDGATKEDQMRDTLGPRESRELGCEISQNGHQMLTLLRVIF